MLLKLRKTLLLSGLGLIAIGTIAPAIASCSKNPKTESTQAPIYDAAVVQSLFEQFIENYRSLALSNMGSTYDTSDIEAKIGDFEEAYESKKIEIANIYSESEMFVEIAKWVKNLAAEYDIVLIEWSNVENNREVIRESALASANYSDEVTYAANLQDDLFDQGIDENKSFNDYADDVAEYDPLKNSAILFPRSHGYTLRASKPLNSKINAAAAKANLLSQTIDSYLKLSDTNLITYFASTEDKIFEDGVIAYNTSGAKLDYSKTTTQIVGEDGNYLNAKNTAYRILTPTAAAALFQYSYLDFDLDKDVTDETVRVFKPFDGTKILDNDSYEVSIAMHINSTNPDNVDLLGYDNYESLTSTFEYDVIVTDTKSKFSLFKDDNKTRYEEGDAQHQVNYFSLVGARTVHVAIPANVSNDHAKDYLKNTLGYDADIVQTIVNAFGFTFSNIKKSDRGTDGRPTDASKLDEALVKEFYYCVSDPSTQTGSFTQKYGTNADLESIKNKWLSTGDADAAIHLQVKFGSQAFSKFGYEYNTTNDVDFSNLKISEANSFLKDVLGEGALQFGVKVEDAANNSPTQYPGSQVDLTLGVYITSMKVVNDVVEYTPIAPIASHSNGLYDGYTVSENSNISSIEQYVERQVAAGFGYNKFFFPLFLDPAQAADSKFCNDLLEKDNLAKHEKIMSFIAIEKIQSFTDNVDDLLTLNRTYYGLSISMVILYGIKAIFDAIMIATQWFNPMALISSIIQLASDILSIIFLSIGISNTGETIDKLKEAFKTFNAYLELDRGDASVGYTAIKNKYDAYMAQLSIFKDPIKGGDVRLAAASRAHTLYNEFVTALSLNLFDFVNDSIQQAIHIDPEFDGSLQWNVFQDTNSFAPYFITSLVIQILGMIMLHLFLEVAGVTLSVGNAAILDTMTCYSIGKWSPYQFEFLTQHQNIYGKLGQKLSARFLESQETFTEFSNLIAVSKPIMKISGIAGIILGVLDVLFSVGYSIASSVIASNVNELLVGLV